MPQRRLGPLTDTMRETHEFLVDFVSDNGFAPSQEQIAEGLGISQPAVIKRLWTLERRQIIHVRDGEHRAIQILKRSL